MVIDRNVYYYVYILFQYRNAPSHSGGKSVCACVCLSVCMCVDIMCVCVFVIQGGGEIIAHPPVCPPFSHNDLFYLFFQNKVLLIPEKWEILILYPN